MNTWKLAGFGEGAGLNSGKFYVSSWRYGEAAKGESPTVMRSEWFATEKEMHTRLSEMVFVD